MALFGYRIWQYRHRSLLEQLARGTGFCLNLDCAVVLLLVLRRLLTWLRSRRVGQLLPLEQHIYLHKMAGWSVYLLSSAHTLFHLANFVNMSEASGVTVRDYLFDTSMGIGWFAGAANITGIALLVILTVMVVCSHRAVRKSGYFEIFYWTHLLSIPTWVLLVLHSPNFWKWFLVPGMLFAVEVACRIWRVCGDRGRSIITAVTLLPSEVVCLTVARPPDFQFHPGDFCYINIPGVAKYEWHPFTISSSPENLDQITFHVRAVGQWTRSLHDKVLDVCLKMCLYDQFMLMRGTVQSTVGQPAAAPSCNTAAPPQRAHRVSRVSVTQATQVAAPSAVQTAVAAPSVAQVAVPSVAQVAAPSVSQVAPHARRRSGAVALQPPQLRRLEWLRRERADSSDARQPILSPSRGANCGDETPPGLMNDGYQGDTAEASVSVLWAGSWWGDRTMDRQQQQNSASATSRAARLPLSASQLKLANQRDVQSAADSGVQSAADSGMQSAADSGVQSAADSGVQSAADSGVQYVADSGVQSVADSVRRHSELSDLFPCEAKNDTIASAVDSASDVRSRVQRPIAAPSPSENSEEAASCCDYVSDAVSDVCVGEERASSVVCAATDTRQGRTAPRVRRIHHGNVDKLDWKVILDGPYGAPSTSVFHAQHAVLIGGGIGVTPFASVLHCIIDRYMAAHRPCPHCRVPTCLEMPSSMLKLKKVDFVWVNRDMRSFEWFLELLHELRESQRLRGSPLDSFLSMQLYKTSSTPITGRVPLRNEVKQGRPDWDKVFAQVRARRHGKVTVFYCGPPSLGTVVRGKAAKYGFGFVKEMF